MSSGHQEDTTTAVKAICGDDVRRFHLPHGADLETIRNQIIKRFSLDQEGKRIALKFRDDENEWCSLSTDEDFSEAQNIAKLQIPPILRVQIWVSIEVSSDDTPGHPAEHPHAHPAVHHGVTCDATRRNRIGTRFHKIGEDYDLCEAEFTKPCPTEMSLYEKIEQPRYENHENHGVQRMFGLAGGSSFGKLVAPFNRHNGHHLHTMGRHHPFVASGGHPAFGSPQFASGRGGGKKGGWYRHHGSGTGGPPASKFVADVNAPDGTNVEPGNKLTKTQDSNANASARAAEETLEPSSSTADSTPFDADLEQLKEMAAPFVEAFGLPADFVDPMLADVLKSFAGSKGLLQSILAHAVAQLGRQAAPYGPKQGPTSSGVAERATKDKLKADKEAAKQLEAAMHAAMLAKKAAEKAAKLELEAAKLELKAAKQEKKAAKKATFELTSASESESESEAEAKTREQIEGDKKAQRELKATKKQEKKAAKQLEAAMHAAMVAKKAAEKAAKLELEAAKLELKAAKQEKKAAKKATFELTSASESESESEAAAKTREQIEGDKKAQRELKATKKQEKKAAKQLEAAMHAAMVAKKAAEKAAKLERKAAKLEAKAAKQQLKAAKKTKLEQSESEPEVDGAPKAEAEPPAVAGPPTPLLSPGSIEEKLEQLRDMGFFDEPENRAAIEMAHGEVSRAIDLLMWETVGRRVSADSE